MNVLLSEIPGLAEALAGAMVGEQLRRDLAFCPDVPLELVPGVLVRHVTPLDLLTLHHAGSPFVAGGVVSEGDLALFLHLLCPEGYNPEGRAAFLELLAPVLETHGARALEIAIDVYLSDALADRPATSGKQKESTAPVVSWVADLVHLLASAYGWSRAEILHTPIAQCYQFIRCIVRDRNPEAVFFNSATDKVRREIVFAYLASQAQTPAEKTPAKPRSPRSKRSEKS